MKKTILLVALVVGVAFTSCKEDAAKKVDEANVEAAATRDATAAKFPKMEFDNKVHDFGTITQGTPVETLFKFTNTGDAPLVIVDAKSSCGCTVPEYTKDPIAPGASGELLVKFNGSGKNQVSKTVTITANTQAGKETLQIKAFVNPKDGAPAKASVIQ